MLSYLKILRPVNGFMSAVAVYIATLVAGAAFYPSMPVLYGMAAVFLISSAGMVINDYFDIASDRINKPHRPLPSGRIHRKVAVVYSALLFATGVYLAYLINEYCFYTAIFASLVLIAYPLKLKKIVLAGNLTVSLLVALNFVFGGLIMMNYMPTIWLAVLAFLANTGREIFKTIDDVMGDKHSGITTLPIKYGVVKARMAAAFFIMLAVIISFIPFFLGLFGMVYLFFVVIADIMFIISIAVPKKLNATICKFAMLIALFAFLSGVIV